MSIAGSPPPTYYRRGWRPEYYLHMVKMPCDRAAAALASRSAASYLRRSAIFAIVFGAVFGIISAFIFFQILSLGPTPGTAGPFSMFLLIFALIFLLVIVAMALSSLRTYRMAGELAGLAAAIESGLMPEDDYCDKTLYQALLTYQARVRYMVPKNYQLL